MILVFIKSENSDLFFELYFKILKLLFFGNRDVSK